MTQCLGEWAAAWRIPPAAVADLQARLADATIPPPVQAPPRSEAAVQAAVRVAASKAGMRVWRNNVGAFEDPRTGAWVRFGLANDTPAMNTEIKSADLIGIRPRIIAAADVGTLIGQFVSFEVKASDWRYTATAREVAQKRWADLVTALGGEARFVSDPSHV